MPPMIPARNSPFPSPVCNPSPSVGLELVDFRFHLSGNFGGMLPMSAAEVVECLSRSSVRARAVFSSPWQAPVRFSGRAGEVSRGRSAWESRFLRAVNPGDSIPCLDDTAAIHEKQSLKVSYQRTFRPLPADACMLTTAPPASTICRLQKRSSSRYGLYALESRPSEPHRT
jgi:hypothetical protein